MTANNMPCILPKMEIPTAFREIAEKGVSQAKENYEKLKAVAFLIEIEGFDSVRQPSSN